MSDPRGEPATTREWLMQSLRGGDTAATIIAEWERLKRMGLAPLGPSIVEELRLMEIDVLIRAVENQYLPVPPILTQQKSLFEF